MANLLIDRIKPGGYVLFYKGSMAFEKALPILAKLEKRGNLTRVPDFKTLQVYRVGARKGTAKKGTKTAKKAVVARPKSKQAIAKKKAVKVRAAKPRVKAKKRR
jgi:hypothetical protein